MRPVTKLFHDIVTELNTPRVLDNVTCTRNGECPDADTTFVCVRGRCMDKTRSHYWRALSPAFYYDGVWKVSNDTSLPAFTESVWMNMGIRVFRQQSMTVKVLTLLSGVAVTAVAATMCVLVMRKM